MTEQLWRPCPNTKGMFPHRQDCECGGHFYAMVPVAAGALLIEDGEEAAIERMAEKLDELLGPSDFDALAMATMALRAAVGEKP